MVNSNPLVFLILLTILVILIIAIISKLLKQPHVLAYILAGILIGPFGFKLITDLEIINLLGEIGVIFLLFFIGMEVSIRKIISNWKVAIYGTFSQIFLSVLFTYLFSFWLDWSLNRILLLGFVISLSSTAVVLKILGDRGEIDTKVGRNAISILLIQDIVVIPMLIIISFLGIDSTIEIKTIILQLIGSILFIGLIIYLIKKGKTVKLHLPKVIKNDKELKIFLGLGLCFGFAFISGFFHLSYALGAFIAGILVSKANEAEWINSTLHSFYIIFVAVFFLSIGMLIDLNFIYVNSTIIIFLVLGIFLTNTFINAFVLRFLKNSWAESLYAGALLSAIGEFSFILGSVAYSDSIISTFDYNLIVSIIALSLLLSPLWISIFKSILEFFEKKYHVKYLKKLKIKKKASQKKVAKD